MSLIASPPDNTKATPLNPTQRVQRIGHAILRWFADEGRFFGRAFNFPAPFVLLLAMLLALTLAWQIGFSYTLDPHSDTYLDEPWYQGFNSVELMKQPDGHYALTPDGRLQPFRWTTADAVLDFPAVGQHNYHIKLTLAGSQNPHPNFTVLVDGNKIAVATAEAGIKTYEYDVPASAINTNGDLQIELKVNSFTPKGDNRDLGVVFFSGEIAATGASWALPPLSQLGLLSALVLIAYLLLARSGFGAWWSAGGAAIIGILVVGAVASPGGRPWLTVFSNQLVFAFGIGYILLILADAAMRRAWSDNVARSWVLTFFVFAFAVRFAGLLHPQNFVVDIGFHVNRLNSLWEQGHLFDKIQSAEWGNRYTIYPPTPYIFAGLLGWLIPNKTVLLEFFMVALDSTRILLIYLLAQKTLSDRRAAILSAFFLAIMPIDWLSAEWGEVSNLFGEWLMLAILTLVILKFDQLRKPGYFALTTFLLLLAFVSHPGEIPLAGLVFLLIGITLARRKGQRTFLAIYLAALVLSFGLYHVQTVGDMVPQAIQTIQSKFSSQPAATVKTIPSYQVGGAVNDDRLSKQYGLTQKIVHSRLQWILGGLAGFWAEARVYFNAWPILVFPWFLWWLWRSRRLSIVPDDSDKLRQARQRLFWAAICWCIVAGLFAIIGLTINLYVRYSLFFLPFASLAMGVFLARLWKRTGRWGGILTVLISIYFVVSTLTLFYDRIAYALHPR